MNQTNYNINLDKLIDSNSAAGQSLYEQPVLVRIVNIIYNGHWLIYLLKLNREKIKNNKGFMQCVVYFLFIIKCVIVFLSF